MKDNLYGGLAAFEEDSGIRASHWRGRLKQAIDQEEVAFTCSYLTIFVSSIGGSMLHFQCLLFV